MRTPSHSLAVIVLFAAAAGGCGREATAVSYRIRVGPAAATVEAAATPEARHRGLSGRPALGENDGMLFLFPQAARVSFWMKDTRVALSIAFITPEGKIADIQDMKPESLDLHTSSVPVTMALEMPSGWFSKSGVKPGDALELPEELKSVRPR